VEDGRVKKVGRGLYALASTALGPEAKLVFATKRTGGVVSALSALHHHGLLREEPASVWISVAHHRNAPVITDPPVRVIWMRKGRLKHWTDEVEIAGARVLIASAQRAVVECFEWKSKVGIGLAIEMLYAYRRSHYWDADGFWKVLRTLRMREAMLPYLDTL